MESNLIANETLQIDNKTISFRRLGSGKRKILFFHGFPGSSAQIAPFRSCLEQFDLEVVCIDRPGYHSSEWSQGRQQTQTTNAAWALLKFLGWTSCEVISVSGGTPFLFAFTKAHPEFVQRISIVSGLGPIATKQFSDLLSWKARVSLRFLPLVPGSLFKKILPNYKANSKPKFNLVRYLLPASKADLKVLQEPDMQKILIQALQEAFIQKGQGPRQDAKEYLLPWSLELINFQGPIDIWHGSDDQILPPEMAKRLSQLIPNSRLHIAPGEGHYSLAFTKIADVLKGIE